MKKEKNTEQQLETIAEPEATVATPKVETKITKVGSLLKEMRLQKGLRLPDIAKTLCIRRVYLDAIEESNYAEIPAFPYGIGFVRSYANYLGLNSSNIVELYKDEITPKSDKDIYVLEPQSEASVPSKKYLLLSLLAIVLIYAGWQAYNSSVNEEDAAPAEEVEQMGDISAAEDLPVVVEDFSAEQVMEAPSSEPAQVTVTEESFVEPKAEEKAEEMVSVAEPEETPKGIVIKVKEETWVEVKDAQKLYLSKVLNAGDTYTIPEGEGMILSVGKVNGVDVLVNGVITQVVKPNKKTNIALDSYLKGNH